MESAAVLGSGLSVPVGIAQPAGTPTPLAFPTRLFPPQGSQFVYRKFAGVIGPGANAQNTPAELQVRLSAGRAAVLFLTLFIDAPTLAANISWTPRINRVSIPGMEALSLLGRAVANIYHPVPFPIEVPRNAFFDVLITDVDGAAWTVGGEVFGWHYVPEGAV